MNDADAIDLALFVFRIGIGAVIAAHGVNHIGWEGGKLGGKISGTAEWFGSMGMRPPRLQAWLASITEIGAGLLLILGLLTPLGSAGLLGVMFVAFTIAHRDKGFFIFNPGQGWEYVATLGLCALLLGTVGPGSWSLDDTLDLRGDLVGWTGLLTTVVAGIGGGVVLLVTCWRPTPD
ncbi:MAG: DoxX family protein [Acidimicrobiia bacterium]